MRGREIASEVNGRLLTFTASRSANAKLVNCKAMKCVMILFHRTSPISETFLVSVNPCCLVPSREGQ
jgi:hypothetical protein